MKDIANIKEMLYQQYEEEVSDNIFLPLPPEAKFVTGQSSIDAYLHFLYIQYGIELILLNDNMSMAGYNIVDDKKFSYFVLRWR
jgi:hypothetical protein